ncbi:uncharacterized protein LOC129939542 [Eupeodes corollae]|uniref:uncharacterized protein LOC129939542 n=1 Tax=Eupeodes corollae TaxID=290404 RepID=UPI002490B603|nr:uncharacterized protein LOC129939542 [Eupeodes corollae]
MENKIVFLFCLVVICSGIVLAEQTGGGYIYQKTNLPQINDFSQTRPHHQTGSQAFSQDLQPPPLQNQQQQNILVSSYFDKGQQNLQNIHRNPVNFDSNSLHNHHQHHQQQQQQPFNQPPPPPALNFELPSVNVPQLNNVNYAPPPQLLFNPQAENNVMRFEFQLLNENLGNSIEQQGCNPEPIVGQFKPELVDLANGGPLTRMITTCGPGNDCKTIVLQADLNRVQAVLPKPTSNQFGNGPHQQGLQERSYNNRVIEGRGNVAASYFRADESNALVRPPNRRLIPYTEIVDDDIYN